MAETIELSTWPSCGFNVAWSPENIIAVGLSESVALLVSHFPERHHLCYISRPDRPSELTPSLGPSTPTVHIYKSLDHHRTPNRLLSFSADSVELFEELAHLLHRRRAIRSPRSRPCLVTFCHRQASHITPRRAHIEPCAFLLGVHRSPRSPGRLAARHHHQPRPHINRPHGRRQYP